MKKPNMQLLENLRVLIGNHLADIATVLDPKYKLTLVARIPNNHEATIIVGDDHNYAAVCTELKSSDSLIAVGGK